LSTLAIRLGVVSVGLTVFAISARHSRKAISDSLACTSVAVSTSSWRSSWLMGARWFCPPRDSSWAALRRAAQLYAKPAPHGCYTPSRAARTRVRSCVSTHAPIGGDSASVADYGTRWYQPNCANFTNLGTTHTESDP